MAFNDDIRRFNEKVDRSAEMVVRGTALSLFSKIVLASPVGNPDLWLYKHPTKGYVDYLTYRDAPEGYAGGRFRANWQVQMNTKPNRTIKSTDKNGGKTINKAKSEMLKYKLGNTIYFINNLPYAEELEEGSSTQAPWGMVKVTVAAFRYIVDSEARKAKAKQ